MLRLVNFNLDKDALRQAFDELVTDEALSGDESKALARRAGRVSTFFANPERIRAICADIVDHFYATVEREPGATNRDRWLYAPTLGAAARLLP